MIPQFLAILLIVFLMTPYGLLVSQMASPLSADWQWNGDDFFWALKNTVIQALGSAFMSVFLGVLGGLGLLWWKRKTSAVTFLWTERALLLPNLLPSLFVIIACMGFFQPFPYGKFGIVLIHTIINTGLVSLLFAQLCLQKLSSVGALALVEGSGRWHFFRVGVLGYLAPDIFYLVLFVFSLAMTSFNVPLLVGGSSGTTLEVLIYENLVINQNWTFALLLSGVQMVLIGILSLCVRSSHSGINTREEQQVLELAEWRWGLFFPVGATLVTLVPPLLAVPQGWRQLKAMGLGGPQLITPLLNSLGLGLATGALVFALLAGACLTIRISFWRRFLLLYLPPGSILMGFAFFIAARSWQAPLGLQVVLGLSIIFFASLYRLALASPLANLERQLEVAEVLGATPWHAFSRVIFPQVIHPMMLACGIGSMWAVGDFALSTILSSEDFHLALVIKSLAGSYRLDAAQTLMIGLYVVAFMCFIFWWRLGDVLSRKLNR